MGGGGQRPIIRGASDCGARQEVLRGIGPRLLEEGLAAVQHPRRDRDSSGLQGCSGAAREGSPRAPWLKGADLHVSFNAPFALILRVSAAGGPQTPDTPSPRP